MNPHWMRRAAASARIGVKLGHGGPFGACIVKNNRGIATAHTTVLSSQDPTCHAEINAIRLASKKLKTFDLSGCEIYSTTEPCPMCFSAIHWAKIRKVFFGTRIQDVQKRGFNELALSCREIKEIGKSPVLIQGKVLKAECLELLKLWDQIPGKATY